MKIAHITKFINKIIFLSSSFLAITIGISYLIYKNNTSHYFVCGNTESTMICGTMSQNYSENAIKGKELFNSNCAACHSLDRNMTGPALRNLQLKYEKCSEEFWFHFITKEDSLIKINNSDLKYLTQYSDYEYNHNFNLSKEEYRFLLDYLE